MYTIENYTVYTLYIPLLTYLTYAHTHHSPTSGHLSGRVEAGPAVQPEDGSHREAGQGRHLRQVPSAG